MFIRPILDNDCLPILSWNTRHFRDSGVITLNLLFHPVLTGHHKDAEFNVQAA
jgi:hypothetical protein